MSQRAFLREFDEAAAEAFAESGLADAATYLRAGAAAASAVPCTVFVDRDTQYVGDGYSQSPSPAITVTVFLAEIGGEPGKGDTITVLEDDAPTDTFSVDRVLRVDESRAVCLVLKDE